MRGTKSCTPTVSRRQSEITTKAAVTSIDEAPDRQHGEILAAEPARDTPRAGDRYSLPLIGGSHNEPDQDRPRGAHRDGPAGPARGAERALRGAHGRARRGARDAGRRRR